MAYTIVKSNGTVLTTIADGTINTTSTSQALPGRNYAGYGQSQDTNFVHQLENFADTTPPANPLRGQLWYNTNSQTLLVCPTDGETNAANWLSLSATVSGGTTTFGAVTVTGNILCNNISTTNTSTAANGIFTTITVSSTADISTGIANIGTANIGTTRTSIITTGAAATTGTITGLWTLNGGAGGNNANGLILNTGGLYISNAGGNLYGIKTDKYMYANGDPISFSGTYSNTNVASYLTVYSGAVLATTITATTLTTGSNTTSGTMTGNFTLSAGSRLNATYADLAERFESDAEYDPGTVVELGGQAEITEVKIDLSEDVFGVVSNSAAYLMNSNAGSDKTHPAIAVSGRVSVKVLGKVKKGDRLVSAGKGKARAAFTGEASAFNTIGRALADKNTDGPGTVEAIVMIR